MVELASDRRVIQCNFTETTNVAPKGARAYLIRLNPGNGNDRIIILVRSHGSRWVEKWESITRLNNFRIKTLPPNHPLYSDERILDDKIADIYLILHEINAIADHEEAIRNSVNQAINGTGNSN